LLTELELVMGEVYRTVPKGEKGEKEILGQDSDGLLMGKLGEHRIRLR